MKMERKKEKKEMTDSGSPEEENEKGGGGEEPEELKQRPHRKQIAEQQATVAVKWWDLEKSRNHTSKRRNDKY